MGVPCEREFVSQAVESKGPLAGEHIRERAALEPEAGKRATEADRRAAGATEAGTAAP